MTAPTHDTPWTPTAKVAVTTIIALWALAAYFIGTTELFKSASPQVFAPIALTAIVPVALFLGAYAVSPSLRIFVLRQDLMTLTMLHMWRIIGFVFLALYAFNILPALFAWGAGLGDVAVGLAAPIVVARLAQDPGFVHSRRFILFHIAGLLDFAVAVVTAGLASGAIPSLLTGPVTSAPMEVWPMNIFPSFIVPAFIILHLTVFLKLGADRRMAADQRHSPLQPA